MLSIDWYNFLRHAETAKPTLGSAHLNDRDGRMLYTLIYVKARLSTVGNNEALDVLENYQFR